MALTDALAKAQAEIKNAPLNKVNPHFKSKYADLAAIRDAVIPVLSNHGIAVTQRFSVHEGMAYCITDLRMGEELISSECPVIADLSGNPQSFGSAQTYARRYSLAALLCISAEEDDDGNAAQQHERKTKPITAKQIQELADLIELVEADQKKFFGYMKIAALKDLDETGYARAKQALEAKRKKG